jgi:hypothetical protein
MKMRHPQGLGRAGCALMVAGLLLSRTSGADDLAPERPYSPHAGLDHARQVYWGDTHLHTSNSVDAFSFGTRLGPETAFRFARGEEVVSTTGQRVRLSRPLDFLVVADHAEGLGVMQGVYDGDAGLMENATLRRWNELLHGSREDSVKLALEISKPGVMDRMANVLYDPEVGETIARTTWEAYTSTAERYNEPGRFTTLVGYEWTSHPEGDNLHRVVVFRDGKQRTDQILPFSSQESADPEDLWRALGAYEAQTGGRVLAIPHNGNLSNGLMFALADLAGNPLTREYAEQRARFEPVVEVTQIKGDGETHPVLSPNDEFADYETWDLANLGRSERKRPEMLQYEYARRALSHGLLLEQQLGVNPFKFGMIGSTDSHTSLATAEEENFFGKHTGMEPSRRRTLATFAQAEDVVVLGWNMTSSGYAAVWARENSREAIFDALARKEVYATTGSRMTVRLFAGFDFRPEDADAPDLAVPGYARGVPMGGDLHGGPDSGAPRFLVAARKDPLGANLDRIQIVKGSLDGGGAIRERVYEVAWSDAATRRPSADGRLPAVGSTVDAATATYTNTIGDPELSTLWMDPDFDPEQRAFYYARVLEIPTPRWSSYDAVRFGLELPPEVPRTTQERAYTSPIWYTPDASR